ncbi:uncharacterized protein I206_107371 [Kwoniella pini CBS 10737]|uniref:Pre-mRNA polyadenylation factor Fip1 domain-containing protein n=1 Tax=Kwoniella pini CBS 10737 TaxID=1296096 RepID=A0A1B9HX40_9TREE|nr:uncharacterized protein I206_05696 [Kwoniella pini CBS 10737]OCF47836.1 hypothetical protein I206_05696 [Kwoniella pini CBS 10737]
MDIDDDDAFLYGDESPPKAEVALPQTDVQNETNAASSVPAQPVASTSNTEAATAVSNGMTAAMAASLAAYGIEPSLAVVDNPEDGGVEEEDEDDEEDSDESDDDIKVVFTGQNARTLDLRKPQTAPSNVIGIGKWAHTATSTTPAPVATPSTPLAGTPSRPIQQTANQTTEYTPTSRPGIASVPPPSTSGPLTNPPISSTPTTTDIGINLQPPASGADILSQTSDGIPPLNPNLPKSELPPVSSSSSSKYNGPGNGIIPSTGQSVFEIDMTQFENSGQPWRKPGSVLSDYFNFGFDEISFPRYLRYKSDMEKGRAAMMNVPPMNGLPPDVATLLHLQQNSNGFNPMLAAQQAQQAQQQQAQMQMMANQIQQQMGMMNPQMQAQMQQMMAMQGLDMSMMNQQMPFAGGPGGPGNMQNQQQQQGQMMPQQQQGMNVRPIPGNQGRPIIPPHVAQGPSEVGEEVKLEEGVETGGETLEPQMIAQMGNPAMRGRMPVRGVPVRGVPLRGRGGGVPLGPRAGFAAPTGPKAGRFRDKDKVDTSGAGSLDYGGGEGGDSDRDVNLIKKQENHEEEGEFPINTGSRSHSQIRSRSHSVSFSTSKDKSRSRSRSRTKSRSVSPPKKSSGSSSRRERNVVKREYDDYTSEDEHRDKDRERDKKRSNRKSTKEKEKDDSSRSKRKREGSGNSVSTPALGPGGWESEEEDERRSRRKRSPSVESEKRTRRSKRR